jgi:hypothetical protein
MQRHRTIQAPLHFWKNDKPLAYRFTTALANL